MMGVVSVFDDIPEPTAAELRELEAIDPEDLLTFDDIDFMSTEDEDELIDELIDDLIDD